MTVRAARQVASTIAAAVHGVTVGRKRGGFRALVACSNEYASSTSRGSLHAGPGGAGLSVCAARQGASPSAAGVDGVTGGRKRGGFRALVACSNEYASSTSRGSLHAGPMNTTPTGKPWLSPIGTVMLGVPAAAATP